MNAFQYSTALTQALQGKSGKDATVVVDQFIMRIKARRHEKLLPQIISLLKRNKADSGVATLTIADTKGEKTAKAEAGVKDVAVKVDPTLIGGWQLEADGKLIDASYKRSLIELYRTIT